MCNFDSGEMSLVMLLRHVLCIIKDIPSFEVSPFVILLHSLRSFSQLHKFPNLASYILDLYYAMIFGVNYEILLVSESNIGVSTAEHHPRVSDKRWDKRQRSFERRPNDDAVDSLVVVVVAMVQVDVAISAPLVAVAFNVEVEMQAMLGIFNSGVG
jgi:hypothetical protein